MILESFSLSLTFCSYSLYPITFDSVFLKPRQSFMFLGSTNMQMALFIFQVFCFVLFFEYNRGSKFLISRSLKLRGTVKVMSSGYLLCYSQWNNYILIWHKSVSVCILRRAPFTPSLPCQISSLAFQLLLKSGNPH